MGFLLILHGYLRWLIALVALIAIVKFAWGWLNKTSYQSVDRGLMAGYTGLMDVNLLLGLVLLFGLGGGFPMHRIEHAATMIIAVVVAHTTAIWRRWPDDGKKFRNNLLAVVISFVLVLVGVFRLRGGWLF